MIVVEDCHSTLVDSLAFVVVVMEEDSISSLLDTGHTHTRARADEYSLSRMIQFFIGEAILSLCVSTWRFNEKKYRYLLYSYNVALRNF